MAVVCVSQHAKVFWPGNDDATNQVELSKLDIACDYFGAFLPTEKDQTFKLIKERLTEAIEEILTNVRLNFLPNGAPMQFKVIRGNKPLTTCYQYEVKYNHGVKLMAVKIYDKVLDMIGREFRHTVSSRIN